MNMAAIEIQYRAPARVAIAVRQAQQRLEAAAARTSRIRRVLWDWLAAAAIVLAFLVLQGWLERRDLEDRLARVKAERDSFFTDKAQLASALAERVAMQPGGVYYVIEADSSQQAQAKLQHITLTLGAAHYDLMDKETPRAWLP
jgi:hypothetical protein